MGMEHGKYNSKLQKYFDEVIRIKKSFYYTKKKLIEEHEVRGMVLKDTQDRYSRVHEAFSRGEAEEEAYLAAKGDLELAEIMANDLHQKLKELDYYQKLRLEKVMIKLNDLKQKYEQELTREKQRLRYQLMKAKHDFLNKLINDKNEYLKAYTAIREKYLEMNEEEKDLQKKAETLGAETILEMQDAAQMPVSEEMDHSDESDQSNENLEKAAIFMIDDWEKAGAVITDEELQDALQSGKISAELEEEIKEAINQGLI